MKDLEADKGLLLYFLAKSALEQAGTDQQSELIETIKSIAKKEGIVSGAFTLRELKEDNKVLAKLLGLEVLPSLDYTKISDSRKRNELLINNIEMEKCLLLFKKSAEERFLDFCKYAFNQIEVLCDYIWHLKIPDPKERGERIVALSNQGRDEADFLLKPGTDFSRIPVYNRLYALHQEDFNGQKDFIFVTTGLRDIRNHLSHPNSSLNWKGKALVDQQNFDRVRQNLNTYRVFALNLQRKNGTR